MPQPTITLALCSLIQRIAIEHLLYTRFGDEPGVWAGVPRGRLLGSGRVSLGREHCQRSSAAQMKCGELSLSSGGHRHVGDPRQHGSPGQQQRKQLMVEC